MEASSYKRLLLWLVLLSVLMAAMARPQMSTKNSSKMGWKLPKLKVPKLKVPKISDIPKIPGKVAQEGGKVVEKVKVTIKDVNSIPKLQDKIGSVFDEAKAAIADPSGFIQQQLQKQLDIITDPLAEALGYKNVCQTDAVRAKFISGGWDNAYYGKRLWDTKSVALLVGTFFPATTAEAVREIMAGLRRQAVSLVDILQKAAQDAGADLAGVLEDLLQQLIQGAISGNQDEPNIQRGSLGLKAKIIHVGCSSSAAGIKLPAEGYFQIAVAYRIKLTKSSPDATVPVPAIADVANIANISSEVQADDLATTAG